MLTKLLINSVNHLFPNRCLLCRQSSQQPWLCDHCWKQLPKIHYRCAKCGSAMAAMDLSCCGQCQIHNPNYTCYANFHYQYPIDGFITQLKFQHKLYYAKLIATLMAQTPPPFFPKSILLPVPLHHKRLRHRGFNQSVVITKHLVKLLNFTGIIDSNYCQRHKHTKPQTTLSNTARRRNVANAFGVDEKFYYGKSVIIIDDVLTTGATISELTKTLLAAGCESVYIWCAAKA